MAAKADFTVRLPEKDLEKLIKMMREAGKAAGMAEDEVNDLMDEVRTGSRKGADDVDKLNKKFDGMGGVVKKVGGLMAAAFAVDQLIEYQKKVIEITASYQKMEAVLTTALGSNSAAQVAMAQIQNFAKKTPYQVNQITESYVKLVNRGLQPTNKQLTALGDFAAASGKDMEQLVEAILDINNTERWTELGLKVKTEGQKIKGTFKGMTVEAKRTEEGALGMVQAFGEMKGVAGAMEGISKTLGGNISNMNDAIERLFKTIGDAESGPMMTFTKWLTDVVNKTADLLEDDIQKVNREVADSFDKLREGLDKLNTEDARKKIEELTTANQELTSQQAEYVKALNGDKKANVDYSLSLVDLQKKLNEINSQFKTNEQVIGYLTRKVDGGKKSWDQYNIKLDDSIQKAMDLEAQLESLAREAFKDMSKSSGDWIDQMVADLDAGFEEIEKNEKDFVASQEDNLKQHIDNLVENYDQQIQLYDGLVTIAQTTSDSIETIRNQEFERRRDAINSQMEYELKMAGDNADAKARIQEDYGRKLEALDKEQAERERKAFLFNQLLSLGQVWIQTRLAIAKAIAASPLTGGEPFATYARTSGLISAGIIAAQTLPAFKDGVVDFKGKGTGTSDENHVMISNGESITTALGTKKFRKYLEAMNDPTFTEKDLTNMVLKQLPEGITLRPAGTSLEGGQIREELRRMSDDVVGAIRAKEHVNITLNGHEYSAEIIDGTNKKIYLAKKFGLKL